MIHTRNYQLVTLSDRPDAPSGISLDVPVLRKRVLRTATLAPEQHKPQYPQKTRAAALCEPAGGARQGPGLRR
ncbi:hypothetical protein ACWD4N_48690, partial [Streptomyces sp. NPDC002586]